MQNAPPGSAGRGVALSAGRSEIVREGLRFAVVTWSQSAFATEKPSRFFCRDVRVDSEAWPSGRDFA